MKLQVALDYMDLDRSLAVAAAVAPHTDWLEAGTSLVNLAGMTAVAALRTRFPDHTVVADMKTADGGRKETEMAFAAGADVSTVLGLVPDKCIVECLEAAGSAGRTVFVDLLGCNPVRWTELHRLGVTHVIYHIGKDQQGQMALKAETIWQLKEPFGFTVAVAGGVMLEQMGDLRRAGPDVVIVGSAITGASDPGAAARAFRVAMEG